MPINLYIARHGNTFESNQIPVMVGKKTDLKLTKKGREQAENLGAYFKDGQIEFDAIFSGELLRQKEFAQIVSRQINHTSSVVNSSALDEVDYGTWEGLEPSQIKDIDSWSKKGIWPDAFNEKEEDKVEKILNFITTLRNQFEDGSNIFAVSSNGIIRQFTKFSEVSNSETTWSRLSEASAIEKLKVATGNYCKIEIQAFNLSIDLNNWNLKAS